MKISKLIKISIICTVNTLLLSGCASKMYRAADASITNTAQQISQWRSDTNKTPPPVVVRSGYYVDTNPVNLNKPPHWLSKRVTLEASQIPFSLLLERLLGNNNVVLSFDDTVKPKQLISLDYSGTIEGALDVLADKLNYAYTITHDTLNWSAFETKTFNISFIPGASNYLVGRTENESEGDAASAYSAGAGGNAVGSVEDRQYSNLEARLSIWSDLERTLNELKSKQGRVIVSESTTSVTVYDHPRNVHAMANYITKLNNNLSEEVAIKVQVLDIQLKKSFNLGIDWNLVVKTLGTQFALMGNLARSTNLIATNLISRSTNSADANFRVGRADASNALLNALSQQGRLRVVTRPEVVTMNDQIATIRITEDTGYIQSINTTFTGVNGNPTTSIIPGTVTDGFTLYILPKIQGDKVYMQISSTLANLIRLEKESTEVLSNNDNNNNNNGNQFQAIELPTISKKQFIQRSVVTSGSTLIIAGFKRLRDETNSAKLFGISALGSKGALSDNVETLVLITPVILKTTG